MLGMWGWAKSALSAILIRRWRFQAIGENVYMHRTVTIDGAERISLGSRVEIGSHVSMRAVDYEGKIEIGEDTVIHPYVIVDTFDGSISIGSNCSIRPFSVLHGHGGLSIGDKVRIAAHAVIIPAQHVFDDIDKPIYEQCETRKELSLATTFGLAQGCGYWTA